MSPTFIFLLSCVQASLIQNVYSQCFGAPPLGCGACAGPAVAAGPYGWGTNGYGSTAGCAGPAYGGAGVGNVAVAGDLPVVGVTAIAGQVPIIGAVSFGGPVPAAGAVTVAGSCTCGCGAPNAYALY